MYVFVFIRKLKIIFIIKKKPIINIVSVKSNRLVDTIVGSITLPIREAVKKKTRYFMTSSQKVGR